MTKNTEVTPTQLINVMVTAIPEIDPVTKEVIYKTTFMPEAIRVRLPDTVINYQLVDPTPEGVQFEDIVITPENDQMSTPTIGRSGKTVTFSDENSAKGTFNVTLHFLDKDGIRFNVDPQVGNDPSVNPTL